MDNSNQIAELFTEIRDQLRENSTRHGEMLAFLRAEAERSKIVIDRSVSLQELAVRRQHSIQVLIIPVIIMCVAVLAWLLFRVWMAR